MHYLDLTLPTPAENLALDEALLETAERAGQPCEVLRLWEPQGPAVVVGRSSHVSREVNLRECQRRGVPILRRASGGAAVVIGPGCLMYSLVLSYQRRPELRAIDQAHRTVLNALVRALGPLAPGLACRGTSDMAIGDEKVSGNSVRCKREHLLYHGTLLYRFPLELIEACLTMPPRQPAYRGGREHAAFVRNLSADPSELRRAMAAEWGADEAYAAWPAELTRQLVEEKYSRREWNYQL